MLENSRKLMDDNNVTPEALHDFIGQQNEAGKAEFAKEVQAVHEEIERDLPKQEPPTRQTRVRPARQMRPDDGFSSLRWRGRAKPCYRLPAIGAISPQSSRVVLDFSSVAYISSAGLRIVLAAAKQIRTLHGGFVIFGAEPTVRRVFEISGFARIIPLVASEAEALELVQR